MPETTDGGVIVGEIACDTVCFLPSDPCKFGVWHCEDEASPECVYLGNRPVGTECGFERACDAAGACVSTATVDSDAGAGDASTTSDSGVSDAGVSDAANNG